MANTALSQEQLRSLAGRRGLKLWRLGDRVSANRVDRPFREVRLRKYSWTGRHLRTVSKPCSVDPGCGRRAGLANSL